MSLKVEFVENIYPVHLSRTILKAPACLRVECGGNIEMLPVHSRKFID